MALMVLSIGSVFVLVLFCLLMWWQQIQNQKQRIHADQIKNEERPGYLNGIWCDCHPPMGLHPIDLPLESGHWKFR